MGRRDKGLSLWSHGDSRSLSSVFDLEVISLRANGQSWSVMPTHADSVLILKKPKSPFLLTVIVHQMFIIIKISQWYPTNPNNRNNSVIDSYADKTPSQVGRESPNAFVYKGMAGTCRCPLFVTRHPSRGVASVHGCHVFTRLLNAYSSSSSSIFLRRQGGCPCCTRQPGDTGPHPPPCR